MKKWTFLTKFGQLFTLVFSFRPEIFSFSDLGPHHGMSEDSRIWFLTVKDLVVVVCSLFFNVCVFGACV